MSGSETSLGGAGSVGGAPIASWRDRWSGLPGGVVVLDLGEQPPSDLFPLPDDPLPDPRYRVRLVMSEASGLIQLEHDETTPEEPIGVEPVALVRQAERCVADAAAARLIAPGMRAVEFPSPHGGGWAAQLGARGVRMVESGPAEVVVDVHGMMHDADQRAGLEARVERLAPDGTLLMMIHNVTSIIRLGMWNAAKNGHFAYYSTPVLVSMAAELGLRPVGGWRYPLYDGTTMLAFSRVGEPSAKVAEMAAEEVAEGVTDPAWAATLGQSLTESVAAIHKYLSDASSDGLRVAGYCAASRTASLLCSAGVGAGQVQMVADAAPGKHGRRMPVNRIPIVSPAELAVARPDRVLLFVPDLLDEVRQALPEIEANGGRWVAMDPAPREVAPL